MKRSYHEHAMRAGRAKKIVMANELLDQGFGLSEIAKELNRRRFRNNN